MYARFTECIPGDYADLHLRTHRLSDVKSRNNEAVILVGNAAGRNAHAL